MTYDNFALAWFDLLGKLYHIGRTVAPRGYETRELLGVQLRVDDMTRNVLVHPARALSYRFAVAEWLWIAAGREDVATVARYNRHIAQFSDDGETFVGAYGKRLAPQLDYLLAQLRKPHSRQAVASIWTPSPAPSKDTPCTLSWQLLAREGKLHAIVTMRSSDIWLGLPYDFINFSLLSMGLAGELGLVPGSLIFNLGSSHLYERDCGMAATVLSAPELVQCVSSPRLPGLAPAGEILDYDESLSVPWSVYRDTLQAKTNVDALNCLKELGGAN